MQSGVYVSVYVYNIDIAFVAGVDEAPSGWDVFVSLAAAARDLYDLQNQTMLKEKGETIHQVSNHVVFSHLPKIFPIRWKVKR